jgi:branched-chain amino acid aminotransferase
MSSKVYYIDGEFVPAAEARIPVTDLALLRGYGVFDFFRTYNGLPIQIERNLDRFRNSAGVLGMNFPWTNEELKAIIYKTIQRNGFAESGVRIIATGGDSPNFITPTGQPRLLVYVEPHQGYPQDWYDNGVKLITVNEERMMPMAKSLNYAMAVVAQQQAKAQGAIEALYKDRDGFIREGTTSNIFAYFDDGKVITPHAEILPGITRGRVLEILQADHTVVERGLNYSELMQAKEVIITAANKEVIPVKQIDAHHYDTEPGPWARHMVTAFAEYVQAAAIARDAETA